jgi:S-adenosylmethionine:tRNA ribosyltransferase-isomerase
MLVGDGRTGTVAHHRFRDLPDLLEPGDVLVVNTSGTLPAAIDVVDGGSLGPGLVLHVSTELPDGAWVVELRRAAGASAAGPRCGCAARTPGAGFGRPRSTSPTCPDT